MKDSKLDILREIEANERWLAEFDAPAVSEDALADLKRTVRAELARKQGRRFAMAWRPWQGAMAAAAMLLLSVGVVRYAALHTEPSVVPDFQVALGELPLISETETSIEVESLEALSEMTIGESWALSGASMFETFEAALSDDGEEDLGEAGAMAPQGFAHEAIG